MICRTQDDGWVAFFTDDGETEVFRVKPPDGGFTMAELEQFMEYLKRDAAKREVGPS
jgi:hypothetical protein